MSVLYSPRPSRVEVTANYYSLGDTIIHCGEMQDALYCNLCDEMMGCAYCEFDYTDPHYC